jgi:O-antigen ligase
MFWLWPVALALSQALFNRTLHILSRLLLGLLVLLILYVALVQNFDWKSGYLPAIVAVAAILALRSWRIGLFLVLVGPAAMLYLSSRAIATDEYSYSTRLDAWLIVLNMVKASPLLGFGPANYYWYVLLVPIRGWYSRFSSHNQYVDLVAQTGLLGLACFFWFAFEVALLGWRLRKAAPSGFAQAYVVGVLGGLAGMLASGMLVDWFLPFAYNIGLNGYRGSMLAWLFLGGLVSIERSVYRQAKETRELSVLRRNVYA